MKRNSKMLHTFCVCNRGHVVIDQLTKSREENSHGVVVIAQIAVDEGRDVTGGWQLLTGDWNARQTDTWCIPIKIFRWNEMIRGNADRSKREKYRLRKREEWDDGTGLEWHPNLRFPHCCTGRRNYETVQRDTFSSSFEPGRICRSTFSKYRWAADRRERHPHPTCTCWLITLFHINVSFFFMRWVFTLWREFDSSQQGHRLYLHFCLHSWTRWAGIRWMLGWKLCWSTLPWCKFPCVFSHFMKEKQKQNYEKEMSSVRCLVKTFLRFCCASRRDNIKMREEGLTRWLRAQWGNI